jgi:photosystem II stability/assembly factor-like uncharacterized protein
MVFINSRASRRFMKYPEISESHMKSPNRVSICAFTLLQSFSLLSSFAPAHAQLQSILSAISKDTLLARMRELTGDVPVTIDGQQRTIYTRMSQTTGNRWAGQYLKDQFKRLGLSVQRQYFHGTHMRTPFYVNFTDLARSGRTFWMTSDWGEIFRSDDTARTWISCKQSGTPQLDPKAFYAPPDTSDRLDWICVVDTSTLFTIGKTGIQTVSVDAGKTWQSHQIGFTNLVHAVNNGRTILAVCQNGLAWRSTNLGTNWTKQIIDTTSSIAQAAFVSPTQAYIVGSDKGATTGRLYMTTDAGSTWSLISIPTSAPLQSIFAVDPVHIWIASSDGNVLSTRSGGSSWSSSRYGDSAYAVNRIYFCDTLNGWISASGNRLYRTTNGGMAWALTSTFASTMQIQDFNFLTPSRGILVGGEYSGFSTTDGGTTWKDNTIPLLSNVVATLSGTKPSTRYVLVTAHYDLDVFAPDNRFLAGHGADDDGSGTIGLLELARVFSQHPLPVPIRFAAVPDEEWGADGQLVLGEKLLAEPDTVLAVLDLDMIGNDYLNPRTMKLCYRSDSGSVDLSNRFIKDVQENSIGLDIERQPNTGGSNTDGFTGKASCLMMIESDTDTPYYHRLTDAWNSLHLVFFGDMVSAAAALIYDMGMNGVLPYPKPPPQRPWTSTNGPFSSTGTFTGFAANGTTIFAATTGKGVLLLRNSDTTWTEVNTGLTNKAVLSLALDPAPSGGSVRNVFAGTAGGGVFLSTNNGTNWTPINTGLTDKSVNALASSPDAAGGTIIYAGTAGSGVFRSTDIGTSWTTANAGMENASILSLSVSPGSTGKVIFAGTGGSGVYLSTNSGTNWTLVNAGLVDFTVRALAVVASPIGAGTTVFAGTYGGLFLSTNNGSSWSAVNLDSSNPAVISLAATPTSIGGNVFASSSSGLFLLKNNGSGWIASNVGAITESPIFQGGQAVGVNATHVFIAKTSYGVQWRSLSGLVTSVRSSVVDLPIAFRLEQNYPNPFNPTTNIEFRLPAGQAGIVNRELVTLRIFNILGREVATLVNDVRSAGVYTVRWDASALPSGVYFCRLQAGGSTVSRAMVLMK